MTGPKLDLRLVPRSELRIEACGGATDSLFPEVERILAEEPGAFDAFVHVTRTKSATLAQYESMVDFVFCETFPENRQSCRRYYDGKGPPLRELIAGSPQWTHYNRVMVHAIGLAKACKARDERVHWCRFVSYLKKGVRAHGG